MLTHTDFRIAIKAHRGVEVKYQNTQNIGITVVHMTLIEAKEGKEYVIRRIETDDEELNSFLFSLGCYSGESITVVAHRKSGCVVSIKDGRYNIDNQLAAAIVI